ncbi:hypothetical protein ABK040_014856 [Willaertia magna]
MIDYWNNLDSNDVDSRCSIKMDEESKLKKRKIEKLSILMLTNEEEEKDKFWYKMYQLILFTIPSQMSHLNTCKMSINQKRKETEGLYKIDKNFHDEHYDYDKDVAGGMLSTKLYYFFKWKPQPHKCLQNCNRNIHKLAFVLSLFDKNGLILKPLGTTNEDAVEKPIKELTEEKVNLVNCLEEDLDLDEIVEDDEEEEQKDEKEEDEEEKEDSEEEYDIKDKKKRKDFFSLDKGRVLRRLKPLVECSQVMVGYSHDYDIIPLSRFCYFILCGKENELFKRIDPIHEQFDTDFEEDAIKRDKLKSVAVSPFIEGPFQPFCFYLYLDKKVNYECDPYYFEKYGENNAVRVVENGTPVIGKKKVSNGFKWLTDKLGCTPGFWNASFTWFPLVSVKTKFEKNIIKVTQNEFGKLI